MERNLLVESSDDSANAKDRVTESHFQKIDPCSPDTIARFASPALLALATQNGDTAGVGERQSGNIKNLETVAVNVGESRPSANDKSNTWALLLMKSEKNRNARDQANASGHQRQESEFSKRNDHCAEPVEQQPVTSGNALSTPVVVDFRGSVSGSSNDSGNCTTSGTRSGNSSTDGSPRLRSSEGKADHRVVV